MNDQEFIQHLWRTGAFWNPATPDTHNVTEDSLVTLDIGHRLVQLATMSLQQADANYGHLGISSTEKGVPSGPRTRIQAELPRCPIPDFTPPPGIRSADPDFDGIIRSMQVWAEAGSGSWPVPGCDPTRPDIHSIRVGINTSAAPSKVKAYLAEALKLASACYAEMGLAVRYILDGSDKVEIAKRFESLAGSVIGWNEFPRPGTCAQTINGRLDTGFAPDVLLWANLEVHETGHGVGLQHTRGGIMNPSILLVNPLSWKGTPSEATVRRFFGGVPVPPVDPPGPPDPPPVDPPQPIAANIVIDPVTKSIKVPQGWVVLRG